MNVTVVGLGNPGEEYKDTRHNVGRTIVERFVNLNECADWREDKKANALVTLRLMGKHKAKLVLPNTFMNKSGAAVAKLGVTKKSAEKLIVVYDDMDLPLGTLRVAFGRGDGGHNGIKSIARSIGTKDFVRLRVGVAPITPSGKIKKPQGEEKVISFLMSKMIPKEQLAFRSIMKEAHKALETIINDGRVVAMNQFN